MTRRTFAFLDDTFTPHRGEGAPPITHRFRCTVLGGDGAECAAASAPALDPREAQSWPFSHLRDHPGHTTFAEVIERPWVVVRGGQA